MISISTFILCSTSLIGSGLIVAFSYNPIHRIAYLIAVFIAGSLLMIIFDYYFIGLTYIVVYVGGIMILFLFVIMMVQQHSYPNDNSNSTRKRSYKEFFGIGLFSFFLSTFQVHNIWYYFSLSWDNAYNYKPDISSVAQVLYIHYTIPLLLIGIILFIVMIGIIQITSSA